MHEVFGRIDFRIVASRDFSPAEVANAVADLERPRTSDALPEFRFVLSLNIQYQGVNQRMASLYFVPESERDRLADNIQRPPDISVLQGRFFGYTISATTERIDPNQVNPREVLKKLLAR